MYAFYHYEWYQLLCGNLWCGCVFKGRYDRCDLYAAITPETTDTTAATTTTVTITTNRINTASNTPLSILCTSLFVFCYLFFTQSLRLRSPVYIIFAARIRRRSFLISIAQLTRIVIENQHCESISLTVRLSPKQIFSLLPFIKQHN